MAAFGRPLVRQTHARQSNPIRRQTDKAAIGVPFRVQRVLVGAFMEAIGRLGVGALASRGCLL